MDDTVAISDLLDFLNDSPTPYHAVGEAVRRLKGRGWQGLDERSPWKLEPHAGYFILRNDSSLLAFHTGSFRPAETGIRMITAHTDSPTFRLKGGHLKESNGVLKTSVEVLGGPILSTWLDRDLSLAGRVLIQKENGLESRLYRKSGASVLIPNPAIHLNRDVNKGFELNPQKHLSLLVGENPDKDPQSMYQLIAKDLHVDAAQILDADLIVYDSAKAERTGWNGEFFSSGRIDNLGMCHAALEAVSSVSDQEAVTLAALFDNEEVGSQTPQGAESAYLEHILERIVLASGGDREDYLRSCSRSFIVSADQAHGIHPNFADLHDSAFAPLLNKGPVLKVNANGNYASTGETAAWFRLWCKEEGVPCQTYLNRSDIRGGRSLGPIAASRLGIPSVDVGNPMWSMHSVRETAGVEDQDAMIRIFRRHLRQTGVL